LIDTDLIEITFVDNFGSKRKITICKLLKNMTLKWHESVVKDYEKRFQRILRWDKWWH